MPFYVCNKSIAQLNESIKKIKNDLLKVTPLEAVMVQHNPSPTCDYVGKTVLLTPELQKCADGFINKIDTMGKIMVDEGFLTKEAYEEWKGQYLHRKYASKMKKVSDWGSKHLMRFLVN